MKRSRREMLRNTAGAGTLLLAQSGVAQTGQVAPNEAQAQLRAMLGGFRMTQMIHVVAKLRVADHLKQGAKAVRELAQLTQTHEDSLYRLLRTLAGFGVFFEEEGPAFRLTPMADLLRSDAPGSLRVNAEASGEPWSWRPWGHLMHSVKTGEVAFDDLYGKHTWEWFAENPGPAEIFNALMDEGTTGDARAVVAAYDFSQAKMVVDLGGGRGVLLAAVLGRNGQARGILFDLPHVIDAARKTLDAGIARRVEFAPGDFFKAVPGGGDLYLLKNIIHDWTDSQSRDILNVVHRAMNGRGRLLLVEQIVCGPNRPCPAKTSDMQMMVRNGGRNRTEKEYRVLLAASKFELTRVIPTTGPSVLEAVPRA